MLLTVALVLTLAWGAFAFGAVYPWTYIPLGLACAMVGLWGLVVGRGLPHSPADDARRAPVSRPLAFGLALVALVIAVQLVPVPRDKLVRVNPATDAFLRRYDLQYAALMQSEALRTSRDAEASRYGGADAPPYASHPLSIDPAQTRLALWLLAMFAVFLLGLARGLTSRDVRRLVPWLVGVGVVLALAGIVQKPLYAGKIYGVWRPYATDARPFGPFVNRNHFAGWMIMTLSLGLGYFCALVGRAMREIKPAFHDRLVWFASREANRVILVGFGLLVISAALVMTLSRSGITCFAVALAGAGLVALRRQAKRSKRALVGAYLVFLFVVALGWTGIDAVVSRFEETERSYASRQAIWNDALHIFVDFPVFGSGANTFGTAMMVYQTADPTLHYAEAHNDYLQLLAEGGLLLAIPALVLLVVFARELRRRFRDDTDDSMTYWIRAGALTGLVAIGLQEIVEFSLQMPGNAALFCTLMAIAAGRLPHRGRRAKHGVPGRQIQFNRFRS